MTPEMAGAPVDVTAVLAAAAALAAQGRGSDAIRVLAVALRYQADNATLRHALAEQLWQANALAAAEDVLAPSDPVARDDVRDALLLARIRRGQGRLMAAAQTISPLAEQETSIDTLLDLLEFLRQCRRETTAYTIAERRLTQPPADARLHAFAGNLAATLGRFDTARAHFEAALALDINLDRWFVLEALAHTQRYAERNHPDLARFARCAESPSIGERARASARFALAKAEADIGDLEAAVREYRAANATLARLDPWNAAAWRRDIDARLARKDPFTPARDTGIMPVFVVGLPRTGTTLLADLLGRHPDVRNRGELPFLGYVAAQIERSGRRDDPAVLAEGARLYAAHLVQDDTPARRYVDKNPLNLRYLDTAAALFPQAYVVWCRRDPRDTALSIWMQWFSNPEYAFSHDFDAIRDVHDDAEALLAHWQRTLALPIRIVDYERLAAEPETVLGELLAFLDLAPADLVNAAPDAGAVTSASLWQVRQPIHAHSAGRWHRYAPFLPELDAAFSRRFRRRG